MPTSDGALTAAAAAGLAMTTAVVQWRMLSTQECLPT
jgi:hypothetical protein